MHKKHAVLIIFLAVTLALSACAPNPGGYQAIRQISTSAEGKVYVVPDIAYVSVGVRTQADTVADALTENNSQAQGVSQALQELGVAMEDIQTTSFNVYPQQEYGPNGELTRTYYVVENSVYVTVRNLQSLGELLDRVVRIGANTINGVSFDVVNRDDRVAEARQLAVENARARAQEIAQAAGVEIGELQSVSVYGSPVPVPVFDGRSGGAVDQQAPAIAAGQLIITAEASISYGIQ